MYTSTARKPKGHIVISDSFGTTLEFDTEQCCHCGRHFRIVKGSGKKRGFCLKCNKITCGNPSCDVCMPIEKQLERMERRTESGIILGL